MTMIEMNVYPDEYMYVGDEDVKMMIPLRLHRLPGSEKCVPDRRSRRAAESQDCSSFRHQLTMPCQ